MGTSFNSIMFLKVNRLSDMNLAVECTLISDTHEAVGWMVVEVKSLIIKRAGWAVYRRPDGSPGYFEIPELNGVEAFLNSGPDLKRILAGKENELARELLSECIRGVIQAETFFFADRGFASAADYDRYWDRININACHYYSHLDRVEKPWMEFAGSGERRHNLFNRAKKTSVLKNELGFQVTGVFIDSFHELDIMIQMDPSGIIKSIQGDFTSAPDKICWENKRHLEKFLGKNFPVMTKKDIAALAGGAGGCNHLVDIIYEASRAAAIALSR